MKSALQFCAETEEKPPKFQRKEAESREQKAKIRTNKFSNLKFAANVHKIWGFGDLGIWFNV